MANVIREDIVQLNFEVEGLKELTKLQKEIDDLRKKLTGDLGGDGLDDLAKKSKEAQKPMEKLKEQAEKVKQKVTEIGKKAATTAFNGLKKLAGVSFKALTVGITAAAAGIAGIASKAVSAYADFEQLKGGVETLFGAKGAKSVEEYAKITGKSVDKVKGEYDKMVEAQKIVLKDASNAYKTTGLSANAYMETVTSFSASLISSLKGDTKKAASYANTALVNMSDNANKMGTDMGSLQYAYQGFAKQNYTMLDNLKLGYGGTKTEMERLIKDAAKMKDVQKKLGVTVDANSMSFGNIVQAINVMQESMYINGTTAKEAEGTITGSLNAMKASWGNLLTAMASGENLDQCIDNFVDAVEIVGNNILPVAEKALGGIGTLVERVVPKLAEKFPALAKKLIPPLIIAAVDVAKGLIKALPEIVRTVAVTIVDIFGEQFPIIGKIGNFFSQNADKIAGGIKKIIPVVIGLVAAFKGFKAISAITSMFGGKGGAGGGEKGGFLGGFTNTLKNLAKTKSNVILKGMANLALIMSGVTLMTAAFALVAPLLAKIGDPKQTLLMVAIVGALGFVAGEMAKTAGVVGKIQIGTVLKGFANMAIMLAGLSVLFLLVGAISLIKFDLGAITKIVLIIGLLGLIGASLAVLAAIVGLIPVYVVALGLANMAIIIAGMSALFLLIGACSLLKFDYGKIRKIIGIIVLLGSVGAILAVFAGIVGTIPVPVVLAGLTNIALVIGGLTALIVAFGKLSEVKGFNDFITKGGATLANLFNVIGKIAGSLIGGLGEGLTTSLPKIGENLSAFATSLKPMFTMFNGVDMSGLGNFFKAIGSFMLQMAGNKVLEFFTGAPDFTSIVQGLKTLTTEDTKAFFAMVNSIEETAFTKGKQFFECLDGISSLPNVGGIGQLFSGTNDYAGVAAGLGMLASDSVKAFFTMVSGLNEVAFDNAKLFFESLDGISSLPNVGGLGQLFTGKNDFSGVATGLGQLSGEKVKNFFAMVSGFEATAFNNAKLFFETLDGISALPNSGGFAQLFSGKNDFDGVASGLERLASDGVQKFFTMVNSLNLDNLNGLWNSLKEAGKLTTENLGKVIDESISDLVTKISKLPEKMGDALKNNSKGLSNGLVEMWKDAVKASVAPVNKLLDGANHILKEFGSKKKVIEWTPYARGTGGHKGGNALVNDGNGAELVQMPNGQSFIPHGRNVFLPNAPKGMKVLPAKQTARLMGRKSSTFRYADGVGNLDVWSFIDNPAGLVKKISEKATYEGMSGFALNVGKGMVSTFTGEMTAWVKKLFEEEGALGLADYVASKGVNQWRSTVIRALKMEGQYSAANVARTLYQMQTESGGNPRAINLWDSNARKGIPSKGLMQVIDPTFKSYARSGFNKNIYDPLSNILASIRYATSRYGSLGKAYRGTGYANGVGRVTVPSQTGSFSMSYTPETSFSGGRAVVNENNTYAPVFNLTINGNDDDRTMERKVKRWISEALDDVFDSVARKNPVLAEV